MIELQQDMQAYYRRTGNGCTRAQINQHMQRIHDESRAERGLGPRLLTLGEMR